METFNNLGARYLGLGHNDKTLAALQRAVELDPDAVFVQINLGAALMATGDLKGAEKLLRRVVSRSGEPRAKYMLGLALYAQQQYTDEALDLLNRAQADFPNARLALAAIHAKPGHEKQARQALNTYIETAPEPGKQQARAMLAGLQQR
jgi:tetratricopeptide (TPR) repeat protein